jgi:hypothetical protein
VLEELYLTTEGRLRHVHALRRPTKMQIFCDGEKTPQLTELKHRCHFCIG